MSIFRLLFSSFFSLLAFVSCDDGKLKAGTYVYVSAEQKSKLIIMQNGRFNQTVEYLTRGERIESEGIWEQKNSTILFIPFLKSVAEKKDSLLVPPEKYSSFPGVLKREVIVFDDSSEYWFHHAISDN